MIRKKNIFLLMLFFMFILMNGSLCLHADEEVCSEDHESSVIHAQHSDHADHCETCEITNNVLPSENKALQKIKIVLSNYFFKSPVIKALSTSPKIKYYYGPPLCQIRSPFIKSKVCLLL